MKPIHATSLSLGSPSVVGGVRERAARRRPLHFPRPDRGRRLFAQSGKGNGENAAVNLS